MDILKIELGGNNFFSIKTNYLIGRIFYSKIYTFDKDNKLFSQLNLAEEDEKEMKYYLSRKIVKQIFQLNIERNNTFFANLLDFHILSKLFFKGKDFKETLTRLI